MQLFGQAYYSQYDIIVVCLFFSNSPFAISQHNVCKRFQAQYDKSNVKKERMEESSERKQWEKEEKNTWYLGQWRRHVKCGSLKKTNFIYIYIFSFSFSQLVLNRKKQQTNNHRLSVHVAQWFLFSLYFVLMLDKWNPRLLWRLPWLFVYLTHYFSRFFSPKSFGCVFYTRTIKLW